MPKPLGFTSTDATLNPYGQPQDIIVDGERVGSHSSTRQNAAHRDVYLACFDIPQLPSCSIHSCDLEARRFGPVQKISADIGAVARSSAYGLPMDLLTLTPANFSAFFARPAFAQIQEADGLGYQLVVSFHGADGTEIGLAVDVAIALYRSACRIAEEGRRYQDALAALSKMDGSVVPLPETIDAFSADIEDALSWVSGSAHRVGETIEARCALHSLDGVVGTVHGVWLDRDISRCGVTLRAALPKVAGPEAKLEPEKEGLRGYLAAWGELEIGDDDIDDAFVIRGDKSSRAMLLHAAEPLRALCGLAASVDIGAAEVTLHVAGLARADLTRVLGEMLLFWRHIAMHRAGLTAKTDPFAR